MDLPAELNRLAGTTKLDAAGAANAWAGTTGLELVGALNAKAGTRGLELNGVLQLLSSTRMDANGAAGAISGAFTPASITGLKSWLDAANVGVSNGANVVTWPDSANNGLANPAGGTAKPTMVTSGINSLPSVNFATNQYITFGDVLSGATAASVFVVMDLALDPASVGEASGLWAFSTADVVVNFVWTNGNIYDNFCSTVRKDCGNPTPNMSLPRLYTVTSGPSLWRSYIDGTQFFTTATNTFHKVAAPVFGRSADGIWLNGMVGELILYNNILSDADRALVTTYLKTKWGIS